METFKVDSCSSERFDIWFVHPKEKKHGVLIIVIKGERRVIPERYRKLFDYVLFWKSPVMKFKQVSEPTINVGSFETISDGILSFIRQQPPRPGKSWDIIRYSLIENAIISDMICITNLLGITNPSMIRTSCHFGYISGMLENRRVSFIYTNSTESETIHLFETKKLGRISIANCSHVIFSFETPCARMQGFYFVPVSFLFEQKIFPTYRYPGKYYVTLPNFDNSMGLPIEQFQVRWSENEKLLKIYDSTVRNGENDSE